MLCDIVANAFQEGFVVNVKNIGLADVGRGGATPHSSQVLRWNLEA